MKFKKMILLSLLLLISIPVHALTGNEYNKLKNNERIIWIIGVTDGLITEHLMATLEQPPLAKCLGELEWEQMRAIFEKNLNANPERWHFPASFSFNQTFKKYCNIQ